MRNFEKFCEFNQNCGAYCGTSANSPITTYKITGCNVRRDHFEWDVTTA